MNEGAADDEEPLTEKGQAFKNFRLKAAIFKSFLWANGTPEPPERDERKGRRTSKKRNSGQGIIDLARLLYIGVNRWTEKQVGMTPYKNAFQNSYVAIRIVFADDIESGDIRKKILFYGQQRNEPPERDEEEEDDEEDIEKTQQRARNNRISA